jgi:hypothetical protein
MPEILHVPSIVPASTSRRAVVALEQKPEPGNPRALERFQETDPPFLFEGA